MVDSSNRCVIVILFLAFLGMFGLILSFIIQLNPNLRPSAGGIIIVMIFGAFALAILVIYYFEERSHKIPLQLPKDQQSGITLPVHQKSGYSMPVFQKVNNQESIRYCTDCGGIIKERFCAQCGKQNY